jgi:NAD(P)H-nitrite reductase large subunit
MNAIGFFGTHIVSAGNYIGETYFETGKNSYRKLYYKENRLNGFILIGDKNASEAYEKSGIYTSLIRDKTPLDSIDFDLICKTPALMAFSRDSRVQKLSATV